MQTRWSNYGCWIGHHCHRVAKTTRSYRTIYRIPEVKCHQIKEGWFLYQYRKNQNDCQCEGWTIKKVKMLIKALQNVERIYSLPTTKKGFSPSFNLPGIWITRSIIDIFISSAWEKLTIRCITTTCAKHFTWRWPVINCRSLLNFGIAFGATGWEFSSNLPWIIWISCHFELLLPCRLLLASGTPVGFCNYIFNWINYETLIPVMDNCRQIRKSHAYVGKKNIAPIAVLPFSFHRFYSESKENLIKSTHFLFIQWREIVTLTDPELNTWEFFRVKLIWQNQFNVWFLLFCKIENL